MEVWHVEILPQRSIKDTPSTVVLLFGNRGGKGDTKSEAIKGKGCWTPHKIHSSLLSPLLYWGSLQFS